MILAVMLIYIAVMVNVVTFNGKSNIVPSRGWTKWPANALQSACRLSCCDTSHCSQRCVFQDVHRSVYLSFVHLNVQEHCAFVCTYRLAVSSLSGLKHWCLCDLWGCWNSSCFIPQQHVQRQSKHTLNPPGFRDLTPICPCRGGASVWVP